jgi:hypothetical protein
MKKYSKHIVEEQKKQTRKIISLEEMKSINLED